MSNQPRLQIAELFDEWWNRWGRKKTLPNEASRWEVARIAWLAGYRSHQRQIAYYGTGSAPGKVRRKKANGPTL